MSNSRDDGETYPDAIQAALSQDGDFALALITGTEGPSYRPLGAVMAVLADGRRIGTLSSGCIEKDIALHALATLKSGVPKSVRYGRGSPFIDIKLPCGGGLDILLVPRPDRMVLGRITKSRAKRIPCTLSIEPKPAICPLQIMARPGRTTPSSGSGSCRSSASSSSVRDPRPEPSPP